MVQRRWDHCRQCPLPFPSSQELPMTLLWTLLGSTEPVRTAWDDCHCQIPTAIGPCSRSCVAWIVGPQVMPVPPPCSPTLCARCRSGPSAWSLCEQPGHPRPHKMREVDPRPRALANNPASLAVLEPRRPGFQCLTCCVCASHWSRSLGHEPLWTFHGPLPLPLALYIPLGARLSRGSCAGSRT